MDLILIGTFYLIKRDLHNMMVYFRNYFVLSNIIRTSIITDATVTAYYNV